ncbi:hypothetical protein [Streptomyces sp. NPDC014820]
MLNKVPEVTVWFWVIKVLCTTVGESFADWINMKLGIGLVDTAWIFTAVFVLVLAVQPRLKRYVPFPYWLTVIVVSVRGTLYTDILTDRLRRRCLRQQRCPRNQPGRRRAPLAGMAQPGQRRSSPRRGTRRCGRREPMDRHSGVRRSYRT